MKAGKSKYRLKQVEKLLRKTSAARCRECFSAKVVSMVMLGS